MADKVAILTFDEYPEDTITVRLAPVPLDDYFGVLEAFEAMDDGDSVRAAFAYFARVALMSWTFPEATDGEGMGRRDYSLALAMVREWAKAIRAVVPPLLLTSSAGEPSPERKA